MDLDSALQMIANMIIRLLDLLNSITFVVNNIEVSVGSMIFVFLVFGIIVSVFWRGAKT